MRLQELASDSNQPQRVDRLRMCGIFILMFVKPVANWFRLFMAQSYVSQATASRGLIFLVAKRMFDPRAMVKQQV